jgi:hypothetical protein
MGWIIAYILGILTALKPAQIVERRSKGQDSDAARQKSTVAPAIVTKVVPSPPKDQKPKSTCRPDQTPWWKTVLEGVVIISGVCYAIITFLMWRDSHDNFVVNQRAWIGVDRPITVSAASVEAPHKGKASFVVTVKNFGNSVALSTSVSAEPLIAFDMMKVVSDKTCTTAKKFL